MIKKGFTLPEVIVTIFILGVIAAVLVPAATKSRPDENKIMLRKAYSTVEQTVSELINDDINYPATQTTTVGGIPVQRGFNYTDAGSNGNIPANTDKFCYLFTQKLNTTEDGTCPITTDSTPPEPFKTSDGVLWWLKGSFPTNLVNYTITFDVNGDKGPNCGFTTDYEAMNECNTSDLPLQDQFSVRVRYDGKISIGDYGAEILSDRTNNEKD